MFRAIHSASDRSYNERFSTSARPLGVRVDELETRRHQLFGIVQLGAVQIEKAFAIDDQTGAIALEDLVAIFFGVDLHAILQARTAAADHLDAQSGARLV